MELITVTERDCEDFTKFCRLVRRDTIDNLLEMIEAEIKVDVSHVAKEYAIGYRGGWSEAISRISDLIREAA